MNASAPNKISKWSSDEEDNMGSGGSKASSQNNPVKVSSPNPSKQGKKSSSKGGASTGKVIEISE